MKRFLAITIALSTPMAVLAAPVPASFLFSESPLASSSAPGNGYIAGNTVVITAPTEGDVVAIGGSVVAAGSIGADALLLGGYISSRAPVGEDLRAAGGTIHIAEPVAGDLVAVGYRVDAAGRAGGNVFIAAANASILDGAAGPVRVYGNNVFLAGDFESDVHVVASGAVRLGEGARIRGTLSYESPELARIPDSAVVEGGVEYTNASYLPDPGTSRALAIAGIGVFLLVRILGALILAGLLAGLFPRLAEAVVARVATKRIRSVLLTTLLGFAALVATPILLVLLALTFVGVGIALLLSVAYALLVMLSVIYAGIMLGVLITRRLSRRETVLWHDGVLGMLILSLVVLIPIVGWIVALVLMAFVAGTLLVLFFRAAFPADDNEE